VDKKQRRKVKEALDELNDVYPDNNHPLSIPMYFREGVSEQRFNLWIQKIGSLMPPGVSQIGFDSLSLAIATLIHGSCRIWESWEFLPNLEAADVPGAIDGKVDSSKYYWTIFASTFVELRDDKVTGDDLLEKSLAEPQICWMYWLKAIAAYCWQAIHEPDPVEQWKMIAKAALNYGLTMNALADSKAHVKYEISKLATARAGKAHSHNRDRKASALAWFLGQSGMSKNEAAIQIGAAFNVTEDQARTWLQGDVSASLEKLRRGGANVITPWCERERTIGG
jgi:hypothetical protein